MGKTTLLEALRQELDSNTAVAYVSNSLLPFPAILEYMLEEFEIEKPGESRGPAAGRPAELPDRAPRRRPEHGADPRRGAEPLPADPRADPAPVELRDHQGEDPPDRAGRAAGAAGAARDAGAAPAQAAHRDHVHDPAPDPGRHPELHPDPAPHGRRAATWASSREDAARSRSSSTRTAFPASSTPSATTACSSAMPTRPGASIAGIVEQAIGYLEVGARPRTPRAPQPRRAARHAPGASRARSARSAGGCWASRPPSSAGVAATIFFHPDLFPHAMDLSTSYLADLARSVRALMPDEQVLEGARAGAARPLAARAAARAARAVRRRAPPAPRRQAPPAPAPPPIPLTPPPAPPAAPSAGPASQTGAPRRRPIPARAAAPPSPARSRATW